MGAQENYKLSEDKYYKQFDILREIALLTSSGEESSVTARKAIEMTMNVIGLASGALFLWDDKFKVTLSVSHSTDETNNDLLMKLENEMFAGMRKEQHLISAYVSFGGKEPIAAFTLPIKKGDKVLGAVIGIQPGNKALAREDVFFEALAASLSISMQIGQMESTIEKERYDAVMATATAINHGINNPLQAVLGIVQLLPKELPDLDEKLLRKLRIIEESALAITKITHKLMHISEVKFVEYIDGTKMLDLPEDTES